MTEGAYEGRSLCCKELVREETCDGKHTFGYSSTIFATSGAMTLHFSHHVAVPSRMVTPSYMTALRYSALDCRLGMDDWDIGESLLCEDAR